MSHGLNLIILDDDPDACDTLTEIMNRFYVWGDVISFTDIQEAVAWCRKQDTGVAIFVLDVFLNTETAFTFLDAISDKFLAAYEDAILFTGNASDDVVNICAASDIAYLLEKPIRPYALQLAVTAIVNRYIAFTQKLVTQPELTELYWRP